MKIVLAPDSFKGSLSAAAVASILKRKAEELFEDCDIREVPLANGDSGTIDTLTTVLGGFTEKAMARNYLGETVEAVYGVIKGDTMIIEASELLQEKQMDIHSIHRKMMLSSSAGVGELILQGLDRGYRKIYIGAGSSVVNDGGMGCMHALGVRFYDEDGRPLEASGIHLEKVARIDTDGLDERLADTELTVMCAVNNELIGSEGTTYTYGAQNGAGPEELLLLERGMRSYGQLLEKLSGQEICMAAGAGACGGLPASLMAVCKAHLQSGISTVLKLMDFESIVADASLVIVGEGNIDRTSVYGKSVCGIGMMCKALGIPVVAVVGGCRKGMEQIYQWGVTSVISSVSAMMEEDYAIENAEELLASAAERMFRLLIGGMQMQTKEDCASKARIVVLPN